MCGRFTYRFKWKQIHDLLRITSPPLEFKERYNVAPSQDAPIMRSMAEGRRLDMLRWGLIPSWSKDPKIGYKTINARAETVATSPAFRSAFRKRRCVVPASGFYEWRKAEGAGRKQPFYITAADGVPLLFAGLWERWNGPDGALETFTIVTTTPNDFMKTLHDRMPVILTANDAGRWMELPEFETDALQGLLVPCPSDRLVAHPVSTRVNTPAVDEASLIQPID